MTAQFEFAVYRDSLGKFRWHLRTANGQTIASSQPYNSKDAVEKGIESVKTYVPDARVAYLGKPPPVPPNFHAIAVRKQRRLNALSEKRGRIRLGRRQIP
jgi:uncharacterized protein YegP (UPF0339 family)